jgi:hypothetical protein
MTYLMEDFDRDFTEAHLRLLPPERVFRHFSAEERLHGLPTEERLKGLSIEEIRTYLAKLQE